MKFLNEILIEWSEPKIKDEGILSQKNLSKKMINSEYEDLSFDVWKKRYILKSLPSNNYNHITADVFLEKRNFLDNRGVFEKFYEIVNPFSEAFFQISRKMMEHILHTSACGPRAMLNYVFHSLLFGYPPKNFNRQAGERIRIEYEKFYKQLLTKSDQTVLKIIFKYIKLDEISPEDFLDPVNEWYEEDLDPDGSILDIIMFFRPFEESWDIYRNLI